MISDESRIRLVAGVEIRPPAPGSTFVLDKAGSERVGDRIAEALAAVVPEVTAGHLVTGPALLEPGQALHPERGPWRTMARVAGLAEPVRPGLTSIGSHTGRLSHAELGPYRSPPQGLFVCLPLLLAAGAEHAEALGRALEEALFDRGGLPPPAMAALAEATGLEPVHGQLMTRLDLAALMKMQLAAAGLDPFWPPVEHALFEPDRPARPDLPGALDATWDPQAQRWDIGFVTFANASANASANAAMSPEAYALWLRSLRQTCALLDAWLVDWQVHCRSPGAEVEADGRWVRERTGNAASGTTGITVEHTQVGVVACAAPVDGEYRIYYPLSVGAIDALTAALARRGVTGLEHSGDLGLLASVRPDWAQ
ncbi:MAG: hypothetical protein RQ847_08915 [Wenzhouxiangellaceae bacterium]|nr:hypothetical protein [Wenzhouxiangellaceae bacterium]